MVPVIKTGATAHSHLIHQKQIKPNKPKWEVADVFRVYGKSYSQSCVLPLSHKKIMHSIEACRTALLGGHIEQCHSCGYVQQAYNSCRNRHCPKCQTLTKARWLKAREAEQLPVSYFHVVFTIPHKLNPLALCNKKVLYDILLQSANQTLQKFAAHTKRGLGGKIGITAILHTWDQTLNDHIHLHCAIPAGALADTVNGKQWVHARKNFLFPVKVLSRVFRAKFLGALQSAYQKKRLSFPGRTMGLSKPVDFAVFISQLFQKQWMVYSKTGFAGPHRVLGYLARYTHRVALSNDRIMSIDQGQVSFVYRDSKDRNQKKIMSLSAHEFIRRFLLHCLPSSYVRIRHFGFLANKTKSKDLARCRQLLGLSPDIPKPEKTPFVELLKDLTGNDITRCPICPQGRMYVVAELPRQTIWDSS